MGIFDDHQAQLRRDRSLDGSIIPSYPSVPMTMQTSTDRTSSSESSAAPSLRFGNSASTKSRSESPEFSAAMHSRTQTSSPFVGSANPQNPSRSLWIGALDPSVTSQELMTIFSPYGPIESLRMMTEKSCAFVNYVEQASAVTARDDVLLRLGGRIGSTTARIGFGKVDASSSGSNSYNYHQHTGMPVNTVKGDSPPPDSDLGLQSSPTRALWIGSIPVTMTPGGLVAIFGDFGPIESIRILSNKLCAFVNYERIEDAVRARDALGGKEIFGSEIGGIRIGYGKAPENGYHSGASASAGGVGVGGFGNEQLYDDGYREFVAPPPQPTLLEASFTTMTVSPSSVEEQQQIMRDLCDGHHADQDVEAASGEFIFGLFAIENITSEC